MKNTFIICFLLALMLFSSPPTIARELAEAGTGQTGKATNTGKPACGEKSHSGCQAPKGGKTCGGSYNRKCPPEDP